MVLAQEPTAQAPPVAPATSAPAAAAEPAKVQCDLRSCVEMAYANHPSLKAAEAKQTDKKAALDLALSERWPTLSARNSVGYLEGESTGAAAALRGIVQTPVSGWFWDSTTTVELPLFAEGTLIFQKSYATAKAEFGVSEQENKIRAMKIDLATKVAQAYVDVLKNGVAVRHQDEIARFSETGLRLAKSQFQQDLISRADLLAAEVQLATAKRDLLLAQNSLAKAETGLAQAVGLDRPMGVEVRDFIDDLGTLPALDTIIARAREQHPEVKQQEFKVKQSKEEVSRVFSGFFPTVSLNSSYGYADDFALPGTSNWQILLAVQLPIWDFGRTKAKWDSAKAKALEEERNLDDTRLRVAQDITTIYYQLRENEASLELTRKQIEQAVEAARLEKVRYEQGLVSIASYHEAEAKVLKFQIDLAGFENDIKLARFRLAMVSAP
jgi:outer membrane protein TolC